MAAKAKNSRTSPAKIKLCSSLPVKVKPTRTKTLVIDGSEQSWTALSRALKTPSPKGNSDDLREALNVLGVKKLEKETAERELRQIITTLLLNRHNERGMRLKEAHAILKDISEASALLEARLKQLPRPLAIRLQRDVSNASPIQDDSAFWHHTLNHLETISAYARKLEKALPLDKGNPRLTLAKALAAGPGGLDPIRSFMRNCLALYARFCGEDSITATVSTNTDCCYRFVASAYRFAMDEEFGRGNEFKAQVKRYRDSSRRRSVGMSPTQNSTG